MTEHRKLRIEELGRISIAENKVAQHEHLTVVLDNVRSLNNIGSVFRTSDAMDVERVILCGISSTPPSPEMHKTALGAEDSVPWKYYEDTLAAIHDLKAEGYTIISIEQTQNSTPLQNFPFSKEGKYAIIMGNEVHGVQQSVVDASDICIELPQFGSKHSMNVSVTTGMVLWEATTKIKGLRTK